MVGEVEVVLRGMEGRVSWRLGEGSLIRANGMDVVWGSCVGRMGPDHGWKSR